MINDIRVGALIAYCSIKRGNKKTLTFIVFVLSLIFLNLVFLPSMIGGLLGMFTGFIQDYPYGDIVIEPTDGNAYINNADNVLKKVRAVEGVRAATKRLDVGASINHKQKVVGVMITGMLPTEEYDVSRYPYIVSEGNFLSDLSRDEIIIGAIIAGTGHGSEIYDNLGEVRPGSFVDVTYSNGVKRNYKVKGIMEGTFEIVDLNALVHYKEIEDVYGLEGKEATSVVVRVTDQGTETRVRDKIREAGVNEQIFTWADKSESLIRQAMQSMGAIDIMSKIVSLIVGAALVLIITYINVMNRKKEIGILKAVGITPRSIVVSYAFLSTFYVLLGIFAGLILYFTLMLYFQANPVVFYETIEISPVIDHVLLVQSIVTMLTLSVIAGILPAWSVSRESILKAIWGQ
ncbi:MAG: FtsX-like permease family protein [Methanomethylovorans sp.]|uniref:ABC transporter permease n=1 Tax=Methanomethylovorans sp. TaxID=2758717 RepID=UPI000A68340A|nr:FtsX-like permease family protein [Methanomethylovorans sp.]